MATPRLRVATLNVLGPANPDWPRRRALIAATLRRLAPDVVALQEVPVGTDPARVAADLLGPGYHARGLGHPADDGVGALLATRWPQRLVDEIDQRCTPRARDLPWCATLVVEVDTPVGRTLVAHHKPSWQFGFELEREQQALAAVRLLEHHAPTADHTIVLGDFDATPDAASLLLWRGRRAADGVSVAYQDAWETVRPGEPGFTFDRANPLVRAGEVATAVSRRIDYVLVRCVPHGPTLEVRSCEPLLDRPVDGVWASDHVGVVADLALPDHPPGSWGRWGSRGAGPVRRGDDRGMTQPDPIAPDPTTAYPLPPQPEQVQPAPGLAKDMTPKPDHGEDSYVGHGLLEGRVAVVTGADSGIGRAAAIAFAREGADVVLSYLPEEEPDAQEVVALVEAAGRRAVTVPDDLSTEDANVRLVERTVAELGRIDVLVSVAGKQVAVEDIADLTSEQFDLTFRTNVHALFWLTKAALPHMPPGSSIITTSSVQAYNPSPTLLDYASTKAAINTFSKALAQQLAPKGIRVNVVAPGPFWTPLQVSGGQPTEALPEFGEQSPLGRAGQPAELASTYVYLASSLSSYTTGSTISVTGGTPTP